MITFELKIIDANFKVWDIFYNGTNVGWIRKADKLYLEILYTPYTLRLNQRKFVPSIVLLMCGLMDIKALSDMYTPRHDLKTLTEGLKDYTKNGFTIRD